MVLIGLEYKPMVWFFNGIKHKISWLH